MSDKFVQNRSVQSLEGVQSERIGVSPSVPAGTHCGASEVSQAQPSAFPISAPWGGRNGALGEP